MSHSGVLDHGRCSICLEDYVPVTNPCSDKSHSSACTECLRGYISGLINNAYVGSCPILSCPICLASKSDCKSKARPRLLPAAEMLNLLSHETERMLYDKFVNDLTSIQCSGCHSRQSLNVTWDREYAWPVLVVGMPDTSKVSTLENALNQLDNGDITIEECYKIISVNVYPFMQSKADEDRVALIFERVLMCVREPERRANLQLRYLRDRPFVNSPCCKKPHCFNCKSRNWHEGKSCQENSNTFFDGKILPCPSCGIQLTKGDGCDSITCICKHSFNWNSALKSHEQAEEFRMMYPVDTSYACAAVLCGQISFAIPLAQAWRAKNLLRTNVCLLDLVREKFKQCTSQWVSLFTTASTMGLAPVYDDIKILWREVYRKEVQACEAQNEAAVKSLFPTMFISDTERALFVSGGGSIVNFSKAGILTVFMDIINAGNTIQFKKSQEKWQSNNTVETKAMQEKLRCMKADQFLCIYGHKAPGWMMNDSSRSTFSTVKRFNTFRSDSHLLFRDDNTIVTRVCRISDNPAALVPLTATHSKVRFRILASDNSGSAISFGICDKNFTASGSIGIGPSLGTWGVFENKDLPYPATVYADGVKVATWRTFVAGDSISIECDTSLGICTIRLNNSEFVHTFRSIPPTTGFENYCFGVILANDNIVRVEPIRNVFDPTLLEHHDFNQEHKDMFRCFRDLHSGGSSVRFSLHEQQRAEQRAASWEKILADHGESTDIVFERVYPSLQRMIEGNFCGSNYLQEEEEQRANQWDLQGDNMSWNFIDMALSWGGLNNRLKKSTVAYGENGGLVGKMIQLFETEGKVSQEGTMPVLPVLHR